MVQVKRIEGQRFPARVKDPSEGFARAAVAVHIKHVGNMKIARLNLAEPVIAREYIRLPLRPGVYDRAAVSKGYQLSAHQ